MPRAFTDAERERIRRSLLRAAGEHATTVGLRRLSVSALARSAGISKGAFYAFFDSKEALIITLLEESEAQLRARLQQLAEAPGPRSERLRAVLTTLFDSVHQHPMLRALADPDELAWLLRAVGPELLTAARADDDRFFDGLAAELQAPDAAGGALTGLAALALVVESHRDLIGEDRADGVIGLVIDGLVLRLLGTDAVVK